MMSNPERIILSGMKILLAQQKWITDHFLVVEGGKITAILPIEMLANHLPAQQIVFPADFQLLPGFIDIHIHGVQGKDVMDGTVEATQAISKHLAEEGVTSFLATTTSTTDERLEKTLAAIAQVMGKTIGATLLGIHLEGPYLAPAKKGAHLVVETQEIDVKRVAKWQALASGAIKIITLAPELPGAINAIAKLRLMGIAVSIGHTDATFEQVRTAIEAGATQATHLFNAMRGIHQRDPGATLALLLANEVTAEIIVDGFHLHPAIVDLCYRVKGKNRLVLITDAMRGKCLGDGQYELAGQQVTVRGGKATLSDGTLAGSVLRMPQAIQQMVDYTGCSLIEVIKMATTTPAQLLGLSQRKGNIDIDYDADLVVLNDAFEVQFTMCEGRVVFSKE